MLWLEPEDWRLETGALEMAAWYWISALWLNGLGDFGDAEVSSEIGLDA